MTNMFLKYGPQNPSGSGLLPSLPEVVVVGRRAMQTGVHAAHVEQGDLRLEGGRRRRRSSMLMVGAPPVVMLIVHGSTLLDDLQDELRRPPALIRLPRLGYICVKVHDRGARFGGTGRYLGVSCSVTGRWWAWRGSKSHLSLHGHGDFTSLCPHHFSSREKVRYTYAQTPRRSLVAPPYTLRLLPLSERRPFHPARSIFWCLRPLVKRVGNVAPNTARGGRVLWDTSARVSVQSSGTVP